MAARGAEGDAIRRAIAGLQRLADGLALRRAQLSDEAALPEPQWRVLEEIAAPGFLPSLFARRTETSPPAVSKRLRQLLDKGLVRASISERDARQREYAVTARGRRTLARIVRAREAALQEIWASLDPREVARFAELSEKIADRLERYAQARR